MAQGKVTDFFSARKINPALHASKRRKVEIVTSEIDVRSLDITNTNPYRNLVQNIENNEPIVDGVGESKGETLISPLQTRATRKAKVSSVSKPAKATTRSRKAKVDPKQKLISASFLELEKGSVTLSEAVTSWADNDGAPATPQKNAPKATNTRKRSRQQTLQQDSDTDSNGATPEKRQSDKTTTPASKGRARKKLEMVKVNTEDVKAKLAKVGNLDDLKNRLALMKEARQKIKKAELPVVNKQEPNQEKKSEVKTKAPAYERFHHLTAAAPTLELPFKYKVLSEHFRGMDQVVSILHNRNEVCTFSKLKAAVQELNKRNFEEMHVAQIKTVYDDAYELRQEKGLTNSQGMKVASYQLTIEAKLEEKEIKPAARPIFKASHLLNRKHHFHNSLIHIVKKHHKEFLANLSRPLSIPDHKITRWHPRFPLHEVPDIEQAPLPQPPDVHIFHTAQDVLESTRGKLTPKIEEALKKTMEETKLASPSPPTTTPSKASMTETKPNIAVKGIPLSLLEKIRAKEAANTAAALMRNPKQEKRVIMMKRLPDIMRIIRSQFITEKKPALPLDNVIQRVTDSYRTSIAPGDVEPHINLIMELIPEWLSSIQIKKGKYLKLDRNIDLQIVTEKINNMIKKEK